MNNQRSSSTFSNYNFDFGLPTRSSSTANRPLKDLNNPNNNNRTTPLSSFPTQQIPHHSSRVGGGPLPSWTPNKPSWTHQPAPSVARSGPSNSSSMVGDIFGKSWTSSTTTTSSSSFGIPRSDPNLFGDLVGAALGQGKPSSNVPLKSAPPPRNSFSMGNLADSLPNPSATPARPSSRGSAENLGSYTSVGGGVKAGGAATMKSYTSSGTGQGKDPFGNLGDFGTKPPAAGAGLANSGSKGSSGGAGVADFNFGVFQSSGAKGTPMNSSSKGSAGGDGIGDFSFGDFQNSSSSKASGGGGGSGGDDFSFGEFAGTGAIKSDGFGVPPPPLQAGSGGVDPLDDLFLSSAGAGAGSDAGGGGQLFGEVDDWGMGGEFGSGDGGGATTELDGLPPPPAGVTASAAMEKGLENHKQGQFADAIKWLSWAIALMERSGGTGTMVEVLTCRASCYKEVGEYKKAIADCSKVLDNDGKNVAVLVQRALLYESTEKYKLGAEDLRAVLRIDPTNRIAKTTIHRLTQMAG